jgi:Ca2+-binding RTX toxin-like protein
MANAFSLKETNQQSAVATVSDDGFYAVDHRGNNDDSNAIEFKEALLFELPQSVVAMTFAFEGPVFGATYHIYDADGVRISDGNVEDLMSDGGLVMASSDEPFLYVAFLGGSSGKGNSGEGSAFAVRPVESTLADAEASGLSVMALSDAFEADASLNQIVGTEQDDVIYGTAGNDILTGGEGNDTFVWTSGDAGVTGSPAIDVVTDFGTANNVLDLSDLLQDGNEENIGDYLFAEVQDGDTVLYVNSQGLLDGNPDNADQIVTLQGVALGGEDSAAIIQILLDHDQLKIDQ